VTKMQTIARQAIERLGNDASRGTEQRSASTLKSSSPMVLAK